MIPWERHAASVLRTLGLDSIRSKIFVFAVLATLIPSLSTAWISYLENRRSLDLRVTEALQTASAQSAREVDLWLKERVYDLRVFASSYEVSENLERIQRGEHTPGETRLRDYLHRVRERSPDYDELLVVDLSGKVVTTSAARASATGLPQDWLSGLRAGEPVLGEVRRAAASGKATVIVAVPISGAGGRLLGALTGQATLEGNLEKVLASGAAPTEPRAYVITADGGLLAGHGYDAGDALRANLAASAVQALSQREGVPVRYAGFTGTKMVGTLTHLPKMNWAVVAELPTAVAYSQIARLRNLTFAIVTGLLLVVGLLAYLIGLVIVQPLHRLTAGAAKVAEGDLEVDLPEVSRGEVGYLTEVFNDMVSRLRDSRQALQRLSATDGLTGLYNRRHLMEVVSAEAGRVGRYGGRFSVLMVDLDHFKRYNDTLGHLAGDTVLVRMGALLREVTRQADCAGRYGGEEFLILLPNTGATEACGIAERLRQRLSQSNFAGGMVTLSAGVAEFPADGGTVEAVIASADAALYRAKRGGRDRVNLASASA